MGRRYFYLRRPLSVWRLWEPGLRHATDHSTICPAQCGDYYEAESIATCIQRSPSSITDRSFTIAEPQLLQCHLDNLRMK